MRNRRTQALAMFIDVSRRYPSSATAQAAAIAKRVKGDLNLLESFQELASDYRAWRSIQRAAGVAHDKGRNEDNEFRIPKVLDPERIVKVILGEATLALQMSALTQQDLDQILKLYPDKLGSEQRYGDYVEAHFLRAVKRKESAY